MEMSEIELAEAIVTAGSIRDPVEEIRRRTWWPKSASVRGQLLVVKDGKAQESFVSS